MGPEFYSHLTSNNSWKKGKWLRESTKSMQYELVHGGWVKTFGDSFQNGVFNWVNSGQNISSLCGSTTIVFITLGHLDNGKSRCIRGCSTWAVAWFLIRPHRISKSWLVNCWTLPLVSICPGIKELLTMATESSRSLSLAQLNCPILL